VPAREDPRDALVARDSRKLADLPAGAVVGTGSPRRAAQLRVTRPDLVIRPIRGNVDTRIRLVSSGEVDAVVLARAGLARLGRLDEAAEVLDVDEMLPAPAQGALAVECAGGTDLAVELAALDDPASRAAVEAERAVLAALEAGCSAPVGAYAEATDSEIFLRATVVSTDGAVRVRMSTTGPVGNPRGLGESLAAMMLADGAAALVGERHQ
jgi:hydroxymethylbilane synthase